MADVVAAYCVPAIGQGIAHVPFVEALFASLAWDGSKDARVGMVISTAHAYIPEARTRAVKMFLETTGEWMWWLDYDMVFNPDALSKLLEYAEGGEDRKIVGGLYFTRMDDKQIWPAWLDWEDDLLINVHTVKAGEVRPVANVGMGCTLVHREVFEKMQANNDDPWPWFGHDVISWGDDRQRGGDDVTFCLRAQKLGYTVWGHAGVMCDHVKAERIGWKTFLNERVNVDRAE